MRLENKIKRTFFPALAIIGCCVMATSTEAGVVRIVNNSQNIVTASVHPEPTSDWPTICTTCLGGTCEGNGQVREIIIPTDRLQGHEKFAIQGTDGSVISYGKCSNLSAFKNYHVEFFDKAEGAGDVACRSQEIIL